LDAAQRKSLPQSSCAAGADGATLLADGLSVWVGAMGKSDAGYDYDRYRRLLAEADDEPKRMAFINLLLDEKAKDKLAEQSLHVRLAGLGLTARPKD
jgi:hypothetical protein